MTAEELREEIGIELELMATTVKEVRLLVNDLSDREPTVREKTAGAAFIAQFYGGVENILKRIHRYYGVPMPIGDSWHIEMFLRFCNPAFSPLPKLLDDSLAADLAPFRKFRHVVHHGYGFQLEWERMKDGLQAVENVHGRLVAVLTEYLQKLPS
jgi:ribonuclease HepT-like protein